MNLKNKISKHFKIIFWFISLIIFGIYCVFIINHLYINKFNPEHLLESEEVFKWFPWFLIWLAAIQSILLHIYQVFWFNDKIYFPIIQFFTRPITYLNYKGEISSIMTLLILGISTGVSQWVLDDKGDGGRIHNLRDFFGNTSIVNMIVSFYIGAFGLIVTLIILAQQKQEIVGFERFLNEVADLFGAELREAEASKKVRKIYIVDFQPFIGSKSFKTTAAYKRYEESLWKLAKNENMHLNIICYSKKTIDTKFNSITTIGHQEARIPYFNLIVSKAIEHLEVKHKNVSVWRSDEVGPYHFIITPYTALEYLVIPIIDESDEKNTLIANITNDLTKIDYLLKTAGDIISNSIQPINKALLKREKQATIDISVDGNSAGVKGKKDQDDDNGIIKFQEDNLIIPIELKTQQNNLLGIQIRFQFEDDGIMNHRKGFYPVPDGTHEKYFLLNELTETTEIKNDNPLQYIALLRKQVDNIEFDNYGKLTGTAIYASHRGKFSIRNAHVYPRFPELLEQEKEEILFIFNKKRDTIYLQDGRTLRIKLNKSQIAKRLREVERNEEMSAEKKEEAKKNIQEERIKAFLKIKLINTDLDFTKYSHKTEIKLW